MNNAKRANFLSFINDVSLSTSKKLRVLHDMNKIQAKKQSQF